MDTKQLEEIREQVEKISPGPWSELTDENGGVWILMDDGHRLYVGNLEGTCPLCHFNTEFIISAREDIPALLAEVERLQAELYAARGMADQLAALVCHFITAYRSGDPAAMGAIMDGMETPNGGNDGQPA